MNGRNGVSKDGAIAPFFLSYPTSGSRMRVGGGGYKRSDHAHHDHAPLIGVSLDFGCV